MLDQVLSRLLVIASVILLLDHFFKVPISEKEYIRTRSDK